MGMAASQARYLALVARKSNCEYEGQQINQARTVLSNQSANLFNQMLGLSVPVPPSTSDYTTTQYSYSDGINEYTISSWQQLATPEEDYNYVVTTYYYSDIYTGSQKKLNDPQVQFSSGTSTTVAEIEAAIAALTKASEALETAKEERTAVIAEMATLSNYADIDTFSDVTNCTVNEDSSYTFINGTDDATTDENEAKEYTLTCYNNLTEDEQEDVKAALQILIDNGALDIDLEDEDDLANVYYDTDNGYFAFKDDITSLYGIGTETTLPVYNLTGDKTVSSINTDFATQLTDANKKVRDAQQTYNDAEDDYESLSIPTYVGNCSLTLLMELSDTQSAELKQIVTDMEDSGIDTNIAACFDDDGNYLGGIYSFTMNGTTYYTTYEDLLTCYQSGDGINNIDDQSKLNYYNATYVSTKIEETSKALLETDGNGRFSSVRFEDDSVTYTLTVETVTDDDAYEDAMNQYNYENALYDKTVQDINAQTSIIQQEDQQLELRLKQLDTEQNALSTEIDAVSKVVSDNIEDSFKTFGG